MSNVTLDELAMQEVGEVAVLPPGAGEMVEVEQQPSRVLELFKQALTAETGAGEISTYINHPMNFNGSQGLAQILRGLTGVLGNLNLAIIDIGLGALRFSKEKGGVKNAGIESEGVLIR